MLQPLPPAQLQVGKDDAAFVLGRGGSTKKKIARVCGAELDLNEHDLVLEIHGTDVQREKVCSILRRRPPIFRQSTVTSTCNSLRAAS